MNTGLELPTQRREGAKDAKAEKVAEINRVSMLAVDAALEVHREFGPGLLESAYCAALEVELKERGCFVSREIEVPCIYKGTRLGISYRMDLVIDGCVVIGGCDPVPDKWSHGHSEIKPSQCQSPNSAWTRPRRQESERANSPRG